MLSSKDLPPNTKSFFTGNLLPNQCIKLKPSPPSHALQGQAAIVTGANKGLGFEFCRQLLSHDLGLLILAVRNCTRGEEAVRKLQAEYPNAKYEVWQLDMLSYDSISAFSKRVEGYLPRLPTSSSLIVCLNAGIAQYGKMLKAEETGHAQVLQVNVISTFLLLLQLLEPLRKQSATGQPVRLIIPNSALSMSRNIKELKWDQPILTQWDDVKTHSGDAAYCWSKTLWHALLLRLIDYVDANEICLSLPDPGFVRGTDLISDVSVPEKAIFGLAGALLGRTVQAGTSTMTEAVLAGQNVHGSFIQSYKVAPFNAMFYTEQGRALVDRLWDEMLAELAFARPQALLEAGR